MSASNPVIIKRGRRHAKERHGGAWKVAFADFTLAMMAFFMVLWILEVSNLKERAEIANYMRTHSILDGSPNPFQPDNSPFPVDLGGTPSIVERDAAHSVPPENLVPGMSEFLEIPESDRSPMAGKGEKLNSVLDGKFNSPSELSLLLQAFQEIAAEQMAENHLLVEVVPSGLRVIIRDNEQQQMFRRGAVQMTPFFEDLLLSMGPLLKKIQNKLIISGHTDFTSFSGTQYGNWELSGDRALQARQVLVAGGMPSERVAQVTAFASTRLINEQDKTSSENRRIELLILTTSAEAEMNQLFSPAEDSPAMKQAAEAARRNQPVTRTNL